MSNKSGISPKLWFNIVLFGFMGQVAWSVENVYFNTFLFNKVGGTTADISRMVAASAITAVVTTFIMGTLSDKLGRRKLFLCGGYILWGLTVAVFAFISRENTAKLFGMTDTAAIVAATVSIVVIMDCVMTFMGSTSNDAAFNAWVTDITTPENRGLAEGVLAITPILATVIVTAVFGMLVSSAGYFACFLGLGAVVTICGIVGLFTVQDSLDGVKKKENYFSELIYGFRPSVVKENKSLYICLTAVCIFNIAVQVMMPYLFIYLQHYLGLDLNTIKITGKLIAAALCVLVVFIGGSIGLGALVDKIGKGKFIFPASAVFVIGLFFASKAKTLVAFGAFAVILVAGYGLLMIILNASVRDFMPEDKVGLFQGVRMIFMVLLPMIIGPAIGTRVITAFNDNITYLNEFGEAADVPVPEMFIAAAIVAVFIFIPLVFIRKDFNKVK